MVSPIGGCVSDFLTNQVSLAVQSGYTASGHLNPTTDGARHASLLLLTYDWTIAVQGRGLANLCVKFSYTNNPTIEPTSCTNDSEETNTMQHTQNTQQTRSCEAQQGLTAS